MFPSFADNIDPVLWNRRPLLKKVYKGYFEIIKICFNSGITGPIVELGSGAGYIREVIPEVHCTDFSPNPYIDEVENCYSLSFRSGTIGHLVMIDVLHHLRYPGSALQEMFRVLKPGGRLIMIEPDLGLMGRIVYGLLHHEPVGLRSKIDWLLNGNKIPESDDFAAVSIPYRIFIKGEFPVSEPLWRLIATKRMAAISHMASGGFSGPRLYPVAWYPMLKRIDKFLDRFPLLFSTRLLIVLEKR